METFGPQKRRLREAQTHAGRASLTPERATRNRIAILSVSDSYAGAASIVKGLRRPDDDDADDDDAASRSSSLRSRPAPQASNASKLRSHRFHVVNISSMRVGRSIWSATNVGLCFCCAK